MTWIIREWIGRGIPGSRLGFTRVSRISFQNLRYGRERPKFAHNLPIRHPLAKFASPARFFSMPHIHSPFARFAYSLDSPFKKSGPPGAVQFLSRIGLKKCTFTARKASTVHFLAPGGAPGGPGFLMRGPLNGGSRLYRSVAKFQTLARPPTIRHPLPFRPCCPPMMPASSLRIQSER